MRLRTALVLCVAGLVALAGATACRPAKTRRARPIALKAAHTMPVTHHYQAALEHFARLLGRKTAGRVELQIISTGDAQNEEELVERVRAGEIDIALVSSSALGGIDPSIYSLDLPYLFKSRKQARSLFDGRLGRMFSKSFVPRGLRVLAWWENGYFGVASAERPVASPADLADMRVVTEEVFGPILPVLVAENEARLVEMANASAYGLGASIWTKDLARAEKLARELEVGFVAVNDMVKSDPRLPFGGIKKSGIGRELSHYGLKEFMNINKRYIVTPRSVTAKF